MNARNFLAELKRRNVSESRAHELAGRTKQRPPDRVGVGGSRCPQRDARSLNKYPVYFISAIDWEAIGSASPAL